MGRLQMTTMAAMTVEDRHAATAHVGMTIVAALLHHATTMALTHARTAMVLPAAADRQSMITHHAEAATQMTATAHHRPDEATSRSPTRTDTVVSHMQVVHEAHPQGKVAAAMPAAVVAVSRTGRGLIEHPLDRCGAQHTTPAPT